MKRQPGQIGSHLGRDLKRKKQEDSSSGPKISVGKCSVGSVGVPIVRCGALVEGHAASS